MRPPLQRSGGNILGGGAAVSATLILLAALVAVVVGGLAIAGSWTGHVAASLAPRLAGDATVVVWGRGLESADAAAARAAEILSAEPGTRAAVLEPDDSDPWVGSLIGARKDGSDGPRLVSVDTTSSATPIGRSIARVGSAGIDAVADEHRGGAGPLERKAVVAGVVAGGTTMILLAAVCLAAMIAGRKTVERHRERIALMLRLGARSGFLARLVWWRVGLTVAAGAVLGLAACEAAAFLGVQPAMAGAPPGGGPTLLDGIVALPLPIVLFLIAAVGAGLGARGALKRAEPFG